MAASVPADFAGWIWNLWVVSQRLPVRCRTRHDQPGDMLARPGSLDLEPAPQAGEAACTPASYFSQTRHPILRHTPQERGQAAVTLPVSGLAQPGSNAFTGRHFDWATVKTQSLVHPEISLHFT